MTDNELKMLAALRDVATGKLQHIYHGSCADEDNGSLVRDESCPACQAIAAADVCLPAPTAHELWYDSVEADMRASARAMK